MPKGKSKSLPTWSKIEFVRCDLDADTKKHFAAWRTKEANNLDDLLIEIMQANHKVNFSFNGQTDSFIVSVTGREEECNNANKCYTSHAKDYVTALWVALYKYHVVWQKGVWEGDDNTADFG